MGVDNRIVDFCHLFSSIPLIPSISRTNVVREFMKQNENAKRDVTCTKKSYVVLLQQNHTNKSNTTVSSQQRENEASK